MKKGLEFNIHGRCKKGFTILEAVIALGVLMIAMAPTAGVLVNSIRGSAYNRDGLIAESLALEGLELVKHVRDSNLRKFSAKPECWDTSPGHTDFETCETNKITGGSYVLEPDPNILQWTFTKMQADSLPDDFDLSDNQYRLKLDTVYNHSGGEDTAFYREIFIEHQPGEAIKAASRVFYKNGANVLKTFRAAVFFPTP